MNTQNTNAYDVNVTLRTRSYESIWALGASAAHQDGATFLVTGTADEVSHYVFAYMFARRMGGAA